MSNKKDKENPDIFAYDNVYRTIRRMSDEAGKKAHQNARNETAKKEPRDRQ